ncbi:unnamed protein product [Prunus armeniaca]|uniref:cytokinin dehydrogenase n=1 Tax=Prunus armeniaca TaxID=36596 RepID=A0A6J5VKN7_PRUAR|nr:unnamed protein product [Prunus armeniaca]
MGEKFPTPTLLIVIFFILSRLISTIGYSLRDDPESIRLASSDYGHILRENPAAVLYPTSIDEISSLIKFSNLISTPFSIAARGHGHSTMGQAMAPNGVVVDMMSLKNHHPSHASGIVVNTFNLSVNNNNYYADVGGGQLWIDVLHATLEHGLAPVAWTDYLYLTVGGTLSNAGISGSAFRFGPQISNVYEMDVVTGQGDFVTCSPQNNSDLFFGVLGGLGQFGIITRARIALEPAPKRVKWVRMLYNDFSAYARDQERLISVNGRKQSNALDYLEGLSFLPGFVFEKDVAYVEFLNRVKSGEEKLQSQGQWDVPHPWLNLFVPKSRVSDFDAGVLKGILLKRNITTAPVLLYPMNRTKWDDRMSAVVPEEEVFYTVGFLHSSGFDEWEALEEQNKEILKFCAGVGIEIKQYLPYYKTQQGWMNHFGSKWKTFQKRKALFDPKKILSPGQRIFNK